MSDLENSMNNLSYDSTRPYDQANGIAEIPPSVDPSRPPQRNDDNQSCHCGCPCSKAAAAKEDVDEGIPVQMAASQRSFDSDASTLCSDAEIDGDEGAPEHLIEVGDFGFHSPAAIHRTLARQRRCTCFCPTPPQDLWSMSMIDDESPSGSPGDSMIVEGRGSSADHSDAGTASSGAFGFYSRSSSSVFAFTGGAFGQEHHVLQSLLTRPLPLTPDVRFDYPLGLSIAAGEFGDFREYDMW
ncbi:Hypothetical predicted protein [Lecanosticta acicola]|uniref:Uncharacterized protein n=1 Tax=Lecanosticta acicola TaxID=111012 RepID=A0AAI8Z5H6_9PEZI|nr:Hypothetical predicted protein [Lecanosticta acicola]